MVTILIVISVEEDFDNQMDRTTCLMDTKKPFSSLFYHHTMGSHKQSSHGYKNGIFVQLIITLHPF